MHVESDLDIFRSLKIITNGGYKHLKNRTRSMLERGNAKNFREELENELNLN